MASPKKEKIRLSPTQKKIDTLIKENQELRQSFEELKIKEMLYRSVIDDQTVLIMRYLPNGIRTFVNKNYCNYLRLPEEKLIGTNFFHSLTDLEVDRIKTKLSRLTINNPTNTDEHKVILPGGEVRWNQWTDMAIFSDNNELIEYQAIGQDVTEKKLAEDSLRVSEEKHRYLNEQLEESNILKELLLDIITHDLKNPAGVISGMSELLIDELHNNEMIGVIKDSSENLLNVIENATTLSDVASGEAIHKEQVDLSNILDECIKSFSTQLEKSNITVEKNYKEKLILEANPIISTIFDNYISNAIKYAKEGKKITIDVVDENHSMIIKVKDFGRMIHPQDYTRIFERRTQLAPGSNKGRGLGLAIAKRIAEAHEGRVWIEPNDPKGNVFCFSIPINNIEYDKDNSLGKKGKIEFKDRPIILVVEDNPANMDYLLHLLKKLKLNAIPANSGEDALITMENNYVDCMLLDVNLGKGISGIALMEVFRNKKEYKYIPIAAVTAYFGGGLSKSLLEKGFSDFLAKPYSKDQLQFMLQKYVPLSE